MNYQNPFSYPLIQIVHILASMTSLFESNKFNPDHDVPDLSGKVPHIYLHNAQKGILTPCRSTSSQEGRPA